MKNYHLGTIAIAGLSLLAASQAPAANTYNVYDLLLDFRNASATGDSDITVDLGNVTNFVNAVNALPGKFAVLDSGSGFATSSYHPQFAFSDLTDLLGAPASDNEIGFSACASDHASGTSGNGLIWLTRKQSSASLVPPSIESQQQGLSAQGNTATYIYNIGAETESANATSLPSSGNNAVSYPSGDPFSYQSQAEASINAPNTINYDGSQNTAAGAGGLMEVLQAGSANIYEALWKVPLEGNGSDTYLGYFTFQPDGELDFTTGSPPASVPNVSIAKSGTSVILSWTASSAFTLVDSSAVNGTYTPNTYPTNVSGSTYSVTVPASATAEFFKLRSP